MIILGIESSCDETSAAILKQHNGRIQILSNIIGSSALEQATYGGVIPEQAAREQLRLIIPVIEEALHKASVETRDIDAIAVTYGPGLIGSLLIGVETAKVLALNFNKPLIPVNHLVGHFYANWIEQENHLLPTFPCLGLLVSGGHSDLVLFKEHGEYQYLGGTRDDAAGECFDKCARLLGYPYPGGPKISKLAEKGNPKAYVLPRPMSDSKDLDFSFSGLKTAFANLVNMHFKVSNLSEDNAKYHWQHIVIDSNKLKGNEQLIADLCASLEQAIIDSLIHKTLTAAKQYNIEQLIVAGGVAANKKLISELKIKFKGTVISPETVLCTDNAAMIAAAAFFQEKTKESSDLQANPNLTL